MRGDTLDVDHGAAGVKRFVNDFADFTAVERVREVDGETIELHFFTAAQTGFFIRHECQVNFTVRRAAFHQFGDRAHDRGDARFVIGTEHGVAGRRHNRVADVIFQRGFRFRIKHEIFFFVERNDAAVIIFHDLRRNFRSKLHVYRIDVGAKTDDRRAFRSVGGGGQTRGQNRVFAHMNIFQAQFF